MSNPKMDKKKLMVRIICGALAFLIAGSSLYSLIVLF